MLGIGVLIIFLSIIGITYGYWMQTETQNTFDVLGVKCFELTMSNETKGIHLEEASPVTDEEGKKQTGYTFTIKNTCNTSATYQVNLEEKALKDIKRLDSEYIKVSLNDSTGKNLNTYENTEATIKEEDFTSDKSHKLTSGSLGPEEEETYTLKLWMDYDTPPIEDVMNATFESKISVVATYIEDEKIQNKIEIAYEEQNDYSKEKETITFTVESETENINIIEYSLDGKTYETLEKPSQSITLSLDFTEEQEYTIYFKDALGNTQSQTLTPSKLDKTGPSIEVSEKSDENGAVLDITFEDLKSGLEEYKIVEPGENEEEKEWTKLTEEHTENIEYESDTNKRITIYGKDKLGNINKIEHIITKADTEGPKLTIENPSNGAWSSEKVTITLNATDDISGVSKFYYSTDKNSWNEIENMTQDGKSASATFEITEEYNGTYYFKAEDTLGNESNIEETTIKIDLTSPTITITNPKDNVWSADTTVTINITENGSGVSYCESSLSETDGFTKLQGEILDNKLTVTYNTSQENTIYYRCYDNVNHVSNVKSTTIKLDKEAPTQDFNYDYGYEFGNTLYFYDVNVTVTGSDTGGSGIVGGSYCEAAWSDNESLECEPNIPFKGASKSIALSDGEDRFICAQFTDGAGNTSKTTCSDTWNVGLPPDDEPPEVTFEYNEEKAENYWYKSVDVMVIGSDDISGVDGGVYCEGEWDCEPQEDTRFYGENSDWISLSEGEGRVVCAKMIDNSTNLSDTICSSSYSVDKTPPTIGSVTAQLTGTNIVFTANNVTDNVSGVKSSSGYSFNIQDESGSVGTYTSDTATYTYISGTGGHSYTATVTVTDEAGNISVGVTSNSVTIPKTASLAGMNVPLVETGDGLYEVDHSKEEGTTLAAEWKAKPEWRYAGSNPDNYVWFNCDKDYPKEGAEDNVSRCEKWRIIGLVNVQTKSGITQRLKIVKSSPVANDHWDDENNANDWTKASLMKKLNEINGEKGEYYKTLKDTAINMISDDIIWNIGGTGSYKTKENGLAKHFYGYERGTSTGNGNTNPSTWPAKQEDGTYENVTARVGLIYPSDYGYAVGGTKESRATCLDKEMYNWNTVDGCKNNDWLKPSSGYTWTISPDSSDSNVAFGVYSGGYVDLRNVYASSPGVAPVVYLTSKVKISGGTGDSESPFILKAE